MLLVARRALIKLNRAQKQVLVVILIVHDERHLRPGSQLAYDFERVRFIHRQLMRDPARYLEPQADVLLLQVVDVFEYVTVLIALGLKHFPDHNQFFNRDTKPRVFHRELDHLVGKEQVLLIEFGFDFDPSSSRSELERVVDKVNQYLDDSFSVRPNHLVYLVH